MSPPAPPSRPLVFVVDDDPAVCNSLKFALELDGFAVNTYANGETLLARNESAEARCMIVDFKLMGMSGTDLIGELRRRGVSVPTLLITSNPTDALRRRIAALGVGFIEKPLLGSALADWVRMVCRGEGKPA